MIQKPGFQCCETMFKSQPLHIIVCPVGQMVSALADSLTRSSCGKTPRQLVWVPKLSNMLGQVLAS